MLKGLLSLSFLCSAIQLHAFQVVIFANPAYCGLNNGTAHASPQGGVAPYTYLWDNGATTQSIQDLAPGTYVVTVTDNSGATAQGTATIVVEANMSPYVLEERDACFGCNGRAQVVTPGFQGTPPFTYSTVPAQCSAFPATPGPNGSVYIDYLNGNQTYTITVTDANGCTGSAMADIGQIPSFYQHEAASIQPACGTASNGGFVIADLGGSAINWYVTGPNGIPQTFSFNNGPYVFSGLEAGTYTAAPYDPITGIHFWCEQDAVVVIPAIAPPCGSVSGRVFHDADQDCVFGGADVVIPWKVMTIVPGPM